MKLDYQTWIALDCPDEVPEMPVKVELRSSYPCFPNGGPEMLVNFRKKPFLCHEMDFVTEVLHRSGYYRERK
jgi:hypothetical protein